MMGDPPAPRSGYSTCTVGDNLYLYGGEGALYLNQDFYLYDVRNEKWAKVTTVEWPTARKHACMVCKFPRFYILGGITINGYVSEVWEVDLQALTVKLLSENQGPDPFAYASCFGEYVEDSFVIHLISGETFGEYPLESIFQYDVTKDEWTDAGSIRMMSRASITKVKDKIIMAGGENWGLYSFFEVYSTDLISGTEVYLGDLPRKMYAVASTYYKSAFYVHGGGDTIGLKYRFTVPVSDLVKIEMKENCDDCSWECSPGTFLSESGQCEACPAGMYSADFNSGCLACPAGTASMISGGSSLLQCNPCSEGYFSESEGSERCLMCPGSSICPVGTSTPTAYTLAAATIKSSQPISYSRKSGLLSQVTLGLELGVIGLGFLSILLFAYLKEKRIFAKADLFKKSHNHFVDEVMYIRKRPIGGLFAIWFVLMALFFVVASLTTYMVDNVEENKALVPLVAVEEKYKNLSGDFNLTTTFKNFMGECEKAECSQFIEILVEKVQGKHTTTCRPSNADCIISIYCRGCEVAAGSKVNYFILDSYSYAAAITANLTSTSSIPNEHSSIEQLVEATDNSVFRGPLPTQIFFEVTPSVISMQFFSTEADQTQEDTTGFHIAATKASVLGSQVAASE